MVAAYGRPSLGNFPDPVKEIFYIVLSARTTEVLYQEAHRRLFRRFRTLKAIASADRLDVRECVAVAGLGDKRASQVIAIAQRLISDHGNRPQRALRSMSPLVVFNYLTRLPGVGPKSALCVMMCSLGQDVFPVDVNVQRIFERLGVIRPGLKHYQAQERAPRYVPTGRSRDLHVGLVVHGRHVCLPIKPKCLVCAIQGYCRYGTRQWILEAKKAAR
jgi:endonuclease III